MKKILLLLIITLCFPAIVLAHAFINPPELYDPNWTGAFPYQRNIYWDFNQVSPVGPVGTSPGAIFEGYMDDDLKHSDYVTLDHVTWSSRKGAIGITGGETGVGNAIFHIDNVPILNPVKHIYVEATVINSSGTMEGNWGAPYVFANNIYYGLTNYFSTSLGNNRFRLNAWYDIYPNPYFEDIILPFNVPVGQSVWIDDLHIATECVDVPIVPEPATMMLLGCGLIGIITLRKRKE